MATRYCDACGEETAQRYRGQGEWRCYGCTVRYELELFTTSNGGDA